MIGRSLLNRYEIQAHVGDGATAVVYRAKDQRLGRTVALKVLHSNVKDSVRARFFQEAIAAARLNHPNIMSIYDVGEDHNTHFLVVEYVEGTSLSDMIPSPVKDAVNVGTQVARALHYAHEHHIIHRDIKPANIKVTANGVVKIMDLGLALPPEAKRVTAQGMIIGTPAYLSPEQAQGLPLDPRTDLYSLGILLFEMLTGKLPFPTDDIPALLLAHVQDTPPSVRSLNADIPRMLEEVIFKVLKKQPMLRFANGEEFAQALEASLEHPHVSYEKITDVDANTQIAKPPVNPPNRDQRPIRVLMADDHHMLRRALATYLSAQKRLLVVGEAADGDTTLEMARELVPDILLLDLNMPGKGGLDILPLLRAQSPSVKILVLTGRSEEWYITRALKLGANGYILKSSSEQELVDAILKTVAGSLVLGEGVTEKVVSGMLRGNDASRELVQTERQILLYVAAGYENNQIAEKLELPYANVVESLASAINKLNAQDRYGAALVALRQGDILLEELHALNNATS